MSTIGRNISKRRKELGITQEELAERMGYKSKSSINKIEMGVNDLPQRKIAAFADALNTSPAALMGWTEEDVSQKNTVIARLIGRMRKDDDFYDMVCKLEQLNDTQRSSIKQLLDAFVPGK